jgi:hypothetical protein
MNRREFANWSRGLSDDEFACALAAAGVVDERGLRVSKGVARWRTVDIRRIRGQSARHFATLWRRLVSKHKNLRLSIQGSRRNVDPEWLVTWLIRPAVGVASVSLSAGKWTQDPLPPRPRISLAGRATPQGPNDILIIFQGLTNANAATLGSKAKAVITVGGMPRDSASAMAMLERLRARLGAGTAAAVSGKGRQEWVVALRKALLRRTALDVALTKSLRSMPAPWRMLLIQNEAWLEREEFAAVKVLRLVPSIHRPIVRPLVDIEKEASIEEVYEEDAFEADGGSGSATGGGPGIAFPLPPPPPPTEAYSGPPGPRHLQANVQDIATGREAFRAGGKHLVHVRIGAADAAWITDPRIFDETKLPPSKTGHTLTVVLVEPQFMKKPLVSSLHLPPRGSSTTCSFRLAIPTRVNEVAIRIVLLYRNRVLQTALLKSQANGDDRPKLEPEVVVNPGLTALDIQPEYDAALVFNHSAAGDGKVMGIAGGQTALINTGPMQGLIQKIEDALAAAEWGSKKFQGLQGKGTLALLRKLAGHGRNLLRNLEAKLEGLKTAQRIQLIAAKPGARLPVEYFYSYPLPAKPWKLCPNAAKALGAGACGDKCGAVENSQKYICPLGFWGMSKVLEWQSYRPESARTLKGNDYKLQNAAVAKRKRLQPLSKAVVAASYRANAEDKDAVSSLVKCIKDSEIAVVEVSTWAQWEAKIKSSPSLLLLLPHTDVEEELDQPKMEIGRDQWLTLDRLEKGYVTVGGVRPVVLLLGCETGQQHVAFEDFISNFITDGAAIVVSSATTILGRHAAPVAREFVEVITRMRKNKAATFGDVMLEVRRSMMRKGFPIVMSVSSYGDADWRL